ncbi:ATPase family gene 2 protein homolog A-like isoform X2 [Babylonia areolata]|uniref:ATPase family gene 2 protein homolog A-like isoform X2 n=1 Tax=Babylonia areolata TaxID=304850 RepID=UPI003FD3563E
MGPKKGKGEEWRQCGKCQRVVHRTDLDQHAHSCQDTPTFLLDGVLQARVLHTPALPVRDTVKKLGAGWGDRVVLLHPGTMGVCGLGVGQPCLVSGQHVLWSWPCDGLPPTSLLLPPILLHLLGEGGQSVDVVTVQRFLPPSADAHHVHVCMERESEIYQTDVFSQVLSSAMDGHYVRQHGRHAVRCWGRQCTFRVTAVTTLQPPSLPLHLHHHHSTPPPALDGECPGVDSLSDSLASVDLSATGDDPPPSPLTPLRHTGGERTPAAQSPVGVTTPERSEGQPMGQFHTPLLPTGPPGRGCGGQFFRVTPCTQFHVQPQCVPVAESGERRVTFDSVGGLDRQIEQLRTHCVAPLLAAKTNSVSGQSAVSPSGVLLYGPSGTGKSLLAQALVNEVDVYTVHLSPADLYSKFFGETEKKLQSVFKTARQRCPSVVIVDQVEAVCPRRSQTTSDLEKRVVTTFLTLMDSLTTASRETCVVIGLTSKPDDLDPALRRARRFDLEIETGVPTASDRLQILRAILQDVPHTLTDRELKELADVTHGYVGADLAAVVREGRQRGWKLTEDVQPPLRAEDLRAAIRLVSPSAMREVQFEVPQVRWSDIGGQEEVKLKLRQAVEWPLTHPEAFHRLGITPPAGCLLYGPPGCSKTMIAKALATESGLNFLAVKGPELFEKYVGESERAVREIFRKARAAAPSIIFFDEIDSLAVERGRSGGGSGVADRVLTQLLTEMDGVVQLTGVTIVAATNRPDMVDQALLRPGRFDRLLYVPLPDAATRLQILQIVAQRTPVADDVCLTELVDKTHNYSGAELTALCQEAALLAMTESVEARQVHHRHFSAALNVVLPQTPHTLIQFYQDYTARRGL